MTKVQGVAIIAMLVALLGVVLAGSLTPPSFASRRQRWDYDVRFVSEGSTAAELDQAGSDGWELVSARWARDDATSSWGYEVIFRRPQ